MVELNADVLGEELYFVAVTARQMPGLYTGRDMFDAICTSRERDGTAPGTVPDPYDVIADAVSKGLIEHRGEADKTFIDRKIYPKE